MKKLLPRQYFSHYILPRLLAYAGKAFLFLLSLTCRFKIEGLEQFRKKAKNGNCILMLWHDQLLMVAPILQKRTPELMYNAFISQSRDGEALALFANSFKNGKTIRVKHHAKHGALKEMIDRLKNSSDVLLITPDGPKGPRHQLKPGVLLAAQETNAQVFSLSWSASRYWQLKSWDKMRIPKPFSTITAKITTPIQINKLADLEKTKILLENELTF